MSEINQEAVESSNDESKPSPYRNQPKRSAIVLSPDIQERISVLARDNKISQGHVILAMLELLEGKPEFIEAMRAKREDKVSSRTSKSAILKRLAALTPEQLEALAASLPKD